MKDRRYNKKKTQNPEIRSYVAMMKEYGLTTIVAMNNYISKHNLWNQFDSIKRHNTYASGYASTGISKEAYTRILELFNTDDVIVTKLVSQDRF